MDKFLLIIIPFLSAITLRRIGVIGNRHACFITSYVINFSLPCLTIMTITRLDLKHIDFNVVIIAWLAMTAGAGLSWCVGKILGLTGGKLRSFILVVTFPNTCFVGYPVTFALYGGTGLPYAVIYDQMGMVPLFLTLGFMVAGGRKSLGSALKFPPFIALLFALLINIAGLTILGIASPVLTWAGWTTLPLTIFIIYLITGYIFTLLIYMVFWVTRLKIITQIKSIPLAGMMAVWLIFFELFNLIFSIQNLLNSLLLT